MAGAKSVKGEWCRLKAQFLWLRWRASSRRLAYCSSVDTSMTCPRPVSQRSASLPRPFFVSAHPTATHEVIDDHSGVVLEFIGDAIQCIYGAPLENDRHPTLAVEALGKIAQMM